MRASSFSSSQHTIHHIWDQVEEATKDKEFLLAAAFHYDKSWGTDSKAEQLYCPLGCVVANTSTDRFDDDHFTWATADIESKVTSMFADHVYTDYDCAIAADPECAQYHADNETPTGDSMYIIPRDIALKHFKTSLYKNFYPPTERES